MHRELSNCARLLAVIAILGAAAAAHAAPNDIQVRIIADEMCCDGCARTVSGKLYTARGVKAVEVDLQNHAVTVTLPRQGGASLEELWQAVDEGNGGPTKLVTSDATFAMNAPQVPGPGRAANSPTSVVVDNLHCIKCANKIAAQIYALKGVTKVSADLSKDTLFVESQSNTPISPWQMVDAVTKAKERPLAVVSSNGTLSIEWASSRAPKSAH